MIKYIMLSAETIPIQSPSDSSFERMVALAKKYREYHNLKTIVICKVEDYPEVGEYCEDILYLGEKPAWFSETKE